MNRVLVNIGDITTNIESPFLNSGSAIPESYFPFLSIQPHEVTLNHRVASLPELNDWDLFFDSKGIWKLYHHDHHWAISVCYGANTDQPYHIAILSEDFRIGEIVTNQDFYNQSQKIEFFYPLMELIYANLLGNGLGLIIHACAVKIGGKGLLFPGHSGAGKSTLTRLWSVHQDATLLSDDRVILRKEADCIRIYGTPWHGDARAVSVESAPLHQVFILAHATENSISLLKPVKLAAQMLACSFPPYWSHPGMDYSLGLLGQVSQAVPGYQFGFTPDQDAIHFIRSHLTEFGNG